MFNLKEIREKLKLPNFITLDMLRGICKSVGIKVKNSDEKLSQKDINRLINSKDLNTLIINNNIYNSVSEVSKRIDAMVSQYKKMKERPGISDEEKRNLEEILGDLKNESAIEESRKDSIKSKSKALEAGYLSLANQEDLLSGYDTYRVGTLSNKLDKAEEKVVSEYAELDKLSNMEYSTKRMKKKNEKRIEKTKQRIEILSKKQGLLQTVQHRIVNEANQKYVEGKNKQMLIETSIMDMESKYINDKIHNRTSIQANKSDIDKLKKEIEELKVSGKFSDWLKSIGRKVDKIKLESDVAKLQRAGKKVDRIHGSESRKLNNQKDRVVLQEKIRRLGLIKGTCDLRKQYSVTIKKTFANVTDKVKSLGTKLGSCKMSEQYAKPFEVESSIAR